MIVCNIPIKYDDDATVVDSSSGFTSNTPQQLHKTTWEYEWEMCPINMKDAGIRPIKTI